MLADSANIIPQSGQLDRNIHLPSTVKLELVCFIAEELPRWRDHPDRPAATGEAALTEYLCDHLNSAIHNSSTWSHIQFRTETADEARGGRKIDLAVKPRAATFIIEGRRHSQFESLFPIECKRLPTPIKNGRDEREYVTNEPGTTGGIQRFKFGYHGANHNFAAVIGYIQEQPLSHWLQEINQWVLELSMKTHALWCYTDTLEMLSEDTDTGIGRLKSMHTRSNNLDVLELQHLWIVMPQLLNSSR